jgi:hypothetical protein
VRRIGGGENELLIDAHGIRIPEGWLTDKEFIDENAEGPPVNSCSMASITDDFRGQILWGAA